MRSNFESRFQMKGGRGYAITYNGRQINDSWNSFTQNALFAGILGNYRPLYPLREKAVQQLGSKRSSAEDEKKLKKIRKEDGSYDIMNNWLEGSGGINDQKRFTQATLNFARDEKGKMSRNPDYSQRKETGVPKYGIGLSFKVIMGDDGKPFGVYEVNGVSREAQNQGGSDEFEMGKIFVYADNRPNRVVINTRIKRTQSDERWIEKRTEKYGSESQKFFSDEDKKAAAKIDLENFAKRHAKNLKGKFIELVKAAGIETK